MLALFGLEGVNLFCKPGFFASSSFFVHRAGRGGFIQFFCDKVELLGCGFEVTFLNSILEMFDLGLDLTLSSAICRSFLFVLSCSFFC